jgi:integrase
MASRLIRLNHQVTNRVTMAKFLIYGQEIIVPYLVYKGVKKSTPYYQRRVPLPLVARFGRQVIKQKLDKKDGAFARQANNLAAWHDQLFASMTADPNIVLPVNKRAAEGLLFTYGLKPGDGQIKLTALQNSGAEFTDQPNLINFDADYTEKVERGTLTDTDRLAMQALHKPLPVMCSELWDAYLNDEQRSAKWIKKHKMYFDRFIQLVGDLPVEALSIEVARSYRDQRERLKLKSETVQKEIKFLKAVLKKGMHELGINIRNPFDGVRANKLGKDSVKRETLNTVELKEVIASCKEKGDDLALILLLIAFTGARLGEIIGLRLQDIALTGRAPSIHIREYGQRTLKTSNSERVLPVHPSVLPLLKLQCKAAIKEKKKVLFPRYADGKSMPSSDTASATLNKRLKGMITHKHITNHCFRHTLEDRMRNADITKDRRDEFLGHAKQDSGDNYGQGRALELKKRDLLKAMPLSLG